MEIERKYLVDVIPELGSGLKSLLILQGYITSGAQCREVRVRRIGDAFLLGVKSGGGVEREETEVELEARQFETLWELTHGWQLEKRRYYIPYKTYRIELDIYAGTLSGLVVAEVEFDTIEECNAFIPPDWFGREVSDELAYKNSRLAKNGLPDHVIRPQTLM